jgi:hypothetical protein
MTTGAARGLPADRYSKISGLGGKWIEGEAVVELAIEAGAVWQHLEARRYLRRIAVNIARSYERGKVISGLMQSSESEY